MKFLIARYKFFAGYRARTFSLTRYKFLARACISLARYKIFRALSHAYVFLSSLENFSARYRARTFSLTRYKIFAPLPRRTYCYGNRTIYS